jgi:hypothetical protein
MNDINKSGTTTTKEAPGNDKDREPIEAPWNYRPITGMILISQLSQDLKLCMRPAKLLDTITVQTNNLEQQLQGL